MMKKESQSPKSVTADHSYRKFHPKELNLVSMNFLMGGSSILLLISINSATHLLHQKIAVVQPNIQKRKQTIKCLEAGSEDGIVQVKKKTMDQELSDCGKRASLVLKT